MLADIPPSPVLLPLLLWIVVALPLAPVAPHGRHPDALLYVLDFNLEAGSSKEDSRRVF